MRHTSSISPTCIATWGRRFVASPQGTLQGSVDHHHSVRETCPLPALYIAPPTFKEHDHSGRVPVVACATEARPSTNIDCVDMASYSGEQTDEMVLVTPQMVL